MSTESSFSSGWLWQNALDELNPDIKASLADIINDPKVDVVTVVCLKKQWKVEFRGKTIVLRDLFDKIIA
ncbi:hypothetical protein N7463_009105 [Penicillium fimorum]|uniref:Uncharacterized protein n=1 Tax=Penicillium fimorum TaxID=1882269 RepID=A0A9W9XQ40_9EURO|nr:hypothetical protein N7463_009105 [Penicillium fimorum]